MDRASGVIRSEVRVEIDMSLNSLVRKVPSGCAKAAAHASQMSVVVAMSSSGASS